MPESRGSVVIGVGVLAGIGWLLWRGWRRWNPSAPPGQDQLYRDANLPGPGLSNEQPRDKER